MKKTNVTFNQFFSVVLGTDRAQAATMTLRPGQTTGDAENVHAGSDQWLFVVSGQGEATVAGGRVALTKHTLLVIQAGEPHEIRNTGDAPLETLNVYTPPEY